MNPLVLLEFPSFIYSVAAKQQKVMGSTLRLSSFGFRCLFNGFRVFLAWSRSAGLTARGVTAKMVPLTINAGQAANWLNSSGGAVHFCMPLFSSGLLYHHLSLQLTWDVGASLSVCRRVKLVFSFQLRFIVLNAKPDEKQCAELGWFCLQTAAPTVC